MTEFKSSNIASGVMIAGSKGALRIFKKVQVDDYNDQTKNFINRTFNTICDIARATLLFKTKDDLIKGFKVFKYLLEKLTDVKIIRIKDRLSK